MRKVLFILILLTVASNAWSLQSVPLYSRYSSIAAKGMGGSFSAYPRDASMTLVNPALLNRTKFHLTLLSLTMALDEDLTEVSDFISNNSDAFQNFEDLTPEEQSQLLTDMEPIDDKWVDVGVSPFFGMTIPGINVGIAAYGIAPISLKVDQGVMLPQLGLKGYMDAGVAFGMGFQIATLETGATLRIYQRRSFEPFRVSSSEVGNMNDVLAEGLQELEDPQMGISLDVGAIRSMTDKLDVALTVRNLASSREGWIKPDLVTGMAYKATKRVTLLADVNDWFNAQGVGFFQKVNMGCEVRAPFLLDLRAGIHQGYPTLGFGLRLLLVKLDYAYYGNEGGNLPGQRPEYSHQIGLSVGIN